MDGDCLLCLPLYEKFVENKDGQLGCNLLVAGSIPAEGANSYFLLGPLRLIAMM